MRNQELVKQILKGAFENLTKSSSTFIDIHGYKTAELVVPELVQQGIPSIGVGLFETNKIMVFNVDENGFHPFFSIAERAEKYGSDYTYLDIIFSREWATSHHSASYNYDIGNFKEINEDLASALYVMNAIKKAEEELTK